MTLSGRGSGVEVLKCSYFCVQQRTITYSKIFFIHSFFLGATRLPKFLTYKIRIDADKVDSTKRLEDRLSIKGPRRRPGKLYFNWTFFN